MLLENGADPSYVQHRLGHKDVTVTLKVYKHLNEKMTERGVEVLESLFIFIRILSYKYKQPKLHF